MSDPAERPTNGDSDAPSDRPTAPAPHPATPRPSEPSGQPPGAAPVPTPPAATPSGPLSEPGWFPWQVHAAVGVTTTLTACVLAAALTERRAAGASGPAGAALKAAGLTLLQSPGYSLLGLGALAIVAIVLRRKVGDWRLAASRMLGAVGLFLLIVHLGPFVIGLSLVEWLLGAAAYFLVIWGTFRLSRNNTMLFVAIHLGLWLLVQGAIWLADRPPAPISP